MNHSAILIASLSLAMIRCSASPHDQPDVKDASAAPITTMNPEPAIVYRHGGPSSGGTYYVGYTAAPEPIPMNQLFGIEVAIFGGVDRQRRVSEATLDVDAAMPAHRHGMNRMPKVVSHGDGTFAVTGMLFHMPGHWELYFDVTCAGVTERAQFDVDLE